MAISSSIAGQGTLTGTGTQDTIRTATGTEYHTITFTNQSITTIALYIYINGTANQNYAAPPDMTMYTKESIVFRAKLGTGDIIYAEANTASAVVWTDEMDSL